MGKSPEKRSPDEPVGRICEILCSNPSRKHFSQENLLKTLFHEAPAREPTRAS